MAGIFATKVKAHKVKASLVKARRVKNLKGTWLDSITGRGVNYNKYALFMRMTPGVEPIDKVSKNSQTDTSAGAAYYIHPTTGELVTVAAGEVLNHPTLGNVSFDTYEQLCQDSEDPGEWVLASGATRAATGRTFGPFTEYSIIDAGGVPDRVLLWQSSVSGQPTGILYFAVRYNAGTSGKIRFFFSDVVAGATDYNGPIGSATITTTLAGVLTIISDEYDVTVGYRVLKGSILFDNLDNNQTIGIGPNSSDNSSILVLGADVSEDPAILDFHVPSSGSNVTIASRAGTTKLAGIDTDFPKFRDSLGGEASSTILSSGNLVAANYYEVVTTETDTFGAGIVVGDRVTGLTTAIDANNTVKAVSPAAARHTFTWTPGVDYTDHTTVASIMTPSDSDGFLKASTAGGFELSDGTNTLTLSGVNWVAGTEYPIEIVYGFNDSLSAYKQQLNVKVSGVWLTAIGDFDQYFTVGDDFILGLSNPYQSAVKNHIVEKLSQAHWRV